MRHDPGIRACHRSCWILLLWTGIWSCAQAGDWTLSNSLSLNAIYTDNVGLSGGGESDLVLQVRPTIGLHGRGGRIQADVDYGLSYNQHLSSNNGSNLVNNLRAHTTTELVRDTLFLDANAGAGLSLISSTGARSVDGVNTSGNTTQTYTFSVSPYTRHHLGSTADLLARYTFNTVRHGSGAVSGSNQHQFSAALSSGREFPRTPWSVNFQHSITDYSGRQDSNSHVSATLGYIIDRTLRVNGSTGFELNDVLSSQSNTNGVTWNVGGSWTPNPRTNFDASYGHRYFGSTWALNFSHRTRRTTITGGYSRSVTNARNTQLESNFIDVFDDNGVLIDQLEVFTPTLTNEDFISQSVHAGLSMQGRRSTLAFSANYTLRSYQVTNNDEKAYGFTVSFSRRLSGKLSGNAGASWQQVSPDASPSVSSYSLRLGFSRPIGPHTSVSVNAQHRRGEGGSGGDYTENRISAGLTTQFL